MLRRLNLFVFVMLLTAACRSDPGAPTLRTGRYVLIGSATAPLPLLLRATTDGEVMLAGGSLDLPTLTGDVEELGELTLHIESGPIDGPYMLLETTTLFFLPERRGDRLILHYATADGPIEPDTLQIVRGGILRGSVIAPIAATGRADVVFRLEGAQ